MKRNTAFSLEAVLGILLYGSIDPKLVIAFLIGITLCSLVFYLYLNGKKSKG